MATLAGLIEPCEYVPSCMAGRRIGSDSARPPPAPRMHSRTRLMRKRVLRPKEEDDDARSSARAWYGNARRMSAIWVMQQ